MARLTWLLCAVIVSACAPARYPYVEFGLRGGERERFDELDSAVAGRVGTAVIVYARADVGQGGPVSTGEVNQGFQRFEGQLAPPSAGWLTLWRLPADTVRIGKGYVTGVYAWRPASTTGSVGLGAGVLGFTMWAALRTLGADSGLEPSARLGLVGGAAVLGGLLGRALFGGSRRGDQLYPNP